MAVAGDTRTQPLGGFAARLQLDVARREDDRVVAGVCSGIAAALGVDARLVRLVFALLALAGGTGILLYLALWLWTSGRRPLLAIVFVALATMSLLLALGFSDAVFFGIGLMVAGIVLLARRGARLRPGGSFTVPGIVLTVAGAAVLFGDIGSSQSFLAPGAVAGALLLVLVPWVWQVTHERAAGDDARAPPGARAQALAVRPRFRPRDDARRRARGGRRRGRGRPRRSYRACECRRHGARRAALAARARGARSADERGEALGGGRDRGLRRRRLRRRLRLRPRPRRRLQPCRRRHRPPRPHGVDRSAAGSRRRQRHDHVIIGRRDRGGADVAPAGELMRIVLVDDHELFRAGVRGELGARFDGVGEAVIAAVAPERPGVKFLALSVSDAAEDVIGVIRAGARGYVTKTISSDELADAVVRVGDGDAVFSPRLAGFVLDAFRSGEPVGADPELETLTAREREVLQLIARGYRYKEIAARLHLSVKTIEAHVSSVLRKLQLSSRHELTRWAHERRLI